MWISGLEKLASTASSCLPSLSQQLQMTIPVTASLKPNPFPRHFFLIFILHCNTILALNFNNILMQKCEFYKERIFILFSIYKRDNKLIMSKHCRRKDIVFLFFHQSRKEIPVFRCLISESLKYNHSQLKSGFT